jgi:hypothetical protein
VCSASFLMFFCHSSCLDPSLLRLRCPLLPLALRRWLPGFPNPTFAQRTQKRILRSEGGRGIEKRVPTEERICHSPRPHPMKLTLGCPRGGSSEVTVGGDLRALLHCSFPKLLTLSGLGQDILPSC